MNRISPAACRRLQVLYRQMEARSLDAGGARADRLAWASERVGRSVASFNALTASEGKELIDGLQRALGMRETTAPRRRPMSFRDAQKHGTEGRRDQIHAETTMLDGSEDVFRLIQVEMSALGWDQDRLRAFLRSSHGPNDGRDTIRTLGEANRVHYALKRMAERVGKRGAA